MSELLNAGLPWWGWALLATGLVALVGVIGALFLPDWSQPDYQLGTDAAPGSEAFVDAAAALLNNPVYRGGEVTLLQNGDAFFPAMLEAIRSATDNVTFEVYIFDPDEIGRLFMDAFIDRARSGVEVRLLVDWFGSWRLRRRHRDELTRAGVRVEAFRPFNLRHLVRIYRRTHRRAIVIDGRVAFTGGAAIAKKWAGDVRTKHEWRDSMTRITGPLVGGIQSAFAENWVYCTGEVLSASRFFPDETKQRSIMKQRSIIGNTPARLRRTRKPHAMRAGFEKHPARIAKPFHFRYNFRGEKECLNFEERKFRFSRARHSHRDDRLMCP